MCRVSQFKSFGLEETGVDRLPQLNTSKLIRRKIILNTPNYQWINVHRNNASDMGIAATASRNKLWALITLHGFPSHY